MTPLWNHTSAWPRSSTFRLDSTWVLGLTGQSRLNQSTPSFLTSRFVPETLWNSKKYFVDIRIFVTAILVQRDVGGNLAEILDKISYTIRERFMIQRQIRVYTAQGRMTGYLLAVLPIIMGFLIWMLNAEYMSILFTHPIGRLLIAGAFVLQVIGFLVIRRIVDIEI